MKKLIQFAAAVSIAIFFIMSVSAQTASTDVTLSGGPVKLSAISVDSFGSIELTGLKQTAQASISDFTVTDPRGNAKGWNLQVSATRLRNGENYLHDGALKISGTKGQAVGKSDAFDQSYIKNDFVITEVPGNFIIVPESKGKGTFLFTDSILSLEIWPSEAIAGTYTTTITFDVVHNVS